MRIASPLIAVAALSLTAAACSTDDAVESFVENAIERESGEDVDIDFDSGDGSFSIDTGEGSVSMDEDGNFVITDENGQVITGDVDVDGNGIDVSTDDGSFSMETDEDGNMVMESEDGSIVMGGPSDELPERWPSAVPEPQGIEIQSSAEFVDDSSANISVTGLIDDGPAWAEAYGQQLAAAGFEELSTFTSTDMVSIGYESGDYSVTFSAFDNGDGTWTASINSLQMSS